MKKAKILLSMIIALSVFIALVTFSSAAPDVVEVLTTSTVVVTVTTDLDLAGYDGLWWTGTRYIWVNLSSNTATDFPALVSPHGNNEPPVLGGLGVQIAENQQLHYFNEDNTPGNVVVTLGTVNKDNKTFTITGGPVGTYSHISANVDPDGWPLPEAAFNIGAAQPITVAIDGTAKTLSDNTGIIIKWVDELSAGETPAATATPVPQDTQAPGDFSNAALLAIPAIVSLGAIVIGKRRK